MADEIEISLRSFGRVLLTRDQGNPIRSKLLALVRDGSRLRISFEGVESVTPSFADEVLGRMLLELGEEDFRKHVTLLPTDVSTRRLVNAVLANRKSELARHRA